MVVFVLFTDPLRQEEIELFYTGCQMHRDYYRGYPKAHHPLSYFIEGDYTCQCAPDMSTVYLNFPPYHVKYKQPVVLPATTAGTSPMPQLPDRNLGARYGQTTKSFIR